MALNWLCPYPRITPHTHTHAEPLSPDYQLRCGPAAPRRRRCSWVLVSSSAGGDQHSVATPQAASRWAHPPCRHFKHQSCFRLGSGFEVAAFLTGWCSPVAGALGGLFACGRQAGKVAIQGVAAHGVADARQMPSNLMPPPCQDAHAHQAVRPACTPPLPSPTCPSHSRKS